MNRLKTKSTLQNDQFCNVLFQRMSNEIYKNGIYFLSNSVCQASHVLDL
jgi:hypothetical protein